MKQIEATPSLKNLIPQQIRKTILQMAYNGKSVHVGCAFSLVEIFHVLYSHFVDTKKIVSGARDRDLVCLSKGHGVMALYACLQQIGLVSQEEILNYFSDGSRLTGLSEAHIPGVEVSGGSLGQGVTVAVGLALGNKLDQLNSKVFCIVGDGEINEGSVWEAILISSHQKLKNFVLIVDANDFQAMGRCESILNIEPLNSKLKAFNFEVVECDGHNTEQLKKSLTSLIQSPSEQPKALIARTVKGKGVSWMESDNSWHYSRLNEQTYKAALEEILK